MTDEGKIVQEGEEKQEIPSRLRDNLYDNITISIKNLDRIIAILSILLIALIIVGVIL